MNFKGIFKAIKNLIVLNDRLNNIESTLDEIKSDIARLETRIDQLYQILITCRPR